MNHCLISMSAAAPLRFERPNSSLQVWKSWDPRLRILPVIEYIRILDEIIRSYCDMPAIHDKSQATSTEQTRIV